KGELQSYIEIVATEDTIINGKTAKILHKKETIYRSTTKDTLVNNLGFEYISNTDSLVFIYNGQKFDTLYDFAAKPDDRWALSCCKTEFG
ncbi:MAG: hypothetical protein ACPF8V_08410, partial [Luteibaculum sp.]